MPIKFFNTLGRKKEVFEPIDPKEVRMYTCGPTVYNYAHIGNLRAYIFADVLRKTLEYCGYKVKQVMNITDMGHLVSDADTGDDKMTKGLLREGKALTLENMKKLAEFYTGKFKEDIKKLNIEMPCGLYYASDLIREDVELVKKLEEKGFTYKTSDGIYFDVSKMPDYGALWGGKRTWSEEGARVEVNSEKKHPEDFVLWKFNPKIGFPSPWGQGFPGWHIECSAMGMKYLGEQFDIHTGGVDHISTHHTNEIAQSECATGKKPFVRFWLHSEFVDIGGTKMAKSEDNFFKLSTITDKGINPIAYRYWLLTANYRTKVNFTWEALEGAETALKRLYRQYLDLGEVVGKVNKQFKEYFKMHIENDLDTPGVLGTMWELLENKKISPADKKATLLDFDKVMSLGLKNLKSPRRYILKAETGKFELTGSDEEITYIKKEIIPLAEEREEARKKKDFKKSDELREKINEMGYEVKDVEGGNKINKK